MASKSKGAVYEIAHTKVGTNKDWVQGARVQADDFPDVDFERLVAVGAVREVVAGEVLLPAPPSGHTEQDFDPDAEPVMGPHKEIPLDDAGVEVPDGIRRD